MAETFFILIWWIVPKIGILGLKMADLRPFLYLEKCQNLNRLIFFSPSFRQMFSMIILSNIFENERFGIKIGRNMTFFRKNSFLGIACGLYHWIVQKLLELELSLKICYSDTFWQRTFCKLPLVSIFFGAQDMANFWYAEKFENWTVQVIVIKFGKKLLHINTMNRTKNWHSWPKIGRLKAIFVLGKMPKIEPINISSPSFRQKFSMIILSNIFENEHFRIKNGRNMTFFQN